MKNRRALVLTSVASMVGQFLLSDIYLLQGLGYEVHVACNFIEGNTCSKAVIDALQKQLEEQGVRLFQVDFSRKILKLSANLKAYKKVKLILSENQYTLLHCHSPIGGVIGRLAARKLPAKVIYTAHGFHFHKGAPMCNWLLYYPIEKFCSRFTDVLITINKEDYALAQKKMKAKRVEYIPGVGIDVAKFRDVQVDRTVKRTELGLTDGDIMLLSVGELSKRKNHQVVIRALAMRNNFNIHYYIAGQGQLENYLLSLAEKCGVAGQIHLLGYRSDIPELLKVADIFCFPSLIEGLGLAAVEAMAAGLPIVTSNIHGINDYSINKQTGFSCEPNDVNAFANAISILTGDAEYTKEIGVKNILAANVFDKEYSSKRMKNIYESLQKSMQ